MSNDKSKSPEPGAFQDKLEEVKSLNLEGLDIDEFERRLDIAAKLAQLDAPGLGKPKKCGFYIWGPPKHSVTIEVPRKREGDDE